MGILAAIGAFLIKHAFTIGMVALTVGTSAYGIVSAEQQKAESARIEAKSDAMYADQMLAAQQASAKNTGDLKDIINGTYTKDNDSYLALKAGEAYNSRMRDKATYSYGKTKR